MVLDAPAHGKKYDLASYAKLCDELRARAQLIGGDFTARDVEMAIYSERHGIAEKQSVEKPEGTKRQSPGVDLDSRPSANTKRTRKK